MQEKDLKQPNGKHQFFLTKVLMLVQRCCIEFGCDNYTAASHLTNSSSSSRGDFMEAASLQFAASQTANDALLGSKIEYVLIFSLNFYFNIYCNGKNVHAFGHLNS